MTTTPEKRLFTQTKHGFINIRGGWLHRDGYGCPFVLFTAVKIEIMETIRIIEATEESKLLGFYQDENYEYRASHVVNERGDYITIMKLVGTRATIKMVELWDSSEK